jgi:hypothetical protein
MAKAPTHARAPVTARGAALLALIAGAGDTGLMLTQEEGLDAVNAGYATVDTSVVSGDTAKVTLTPAGHAALTGTANASPTKIEVDTDVEMPEIKARRGRQSSYPFDLLDVNHSFHVAGDPEKIAAKLQSSVASARGKYAVDSEETRELTQREYHKDENGKHILDAEGNKTIKSENVVTRAKRIPTRDFKVLPVGANDPKGPGARVWRTK